MKDNNFDWNKINELDRIFEESHKIVEQIYYFDSNNRMTDKEFATHGIVVKIDAETGERISEERFSIFEEKAEDETESVLRF